MPPRVQVPIGIKKLTIEDILERIKNIKKYLVWPGWYEKKIDESVIAGMPSKQFTEAIEKYVNAYLFESKEPPAAIAAPIMNIADDILSNREITLRAGDYITLQNFVKAR
jgi:hypothetical protein